MAEPYVPIGAYVSVNNLLTALETVTNPIKLETDELEAIVNDTKTAKETAESLLNSKINLNLLGGV